MFVMYLDYIVNKEYNNIQSDPIGYRFAQFDQNEHMYEMSTPIVLVIEIVAVLQFVLIWISFQELKKLMKCKSFIKKKTSKRVRMKVKTAYRRTAHSPSDSSVSLLLFEYRNNRKKSQIICLHKDPFKCVRKCSVLLNQISLVRQLVGVCQSQNLNRIFLLL